MSELLTLYLGDWLIIYPIQTSMQATLNYAMATSTCLPTKV